MSRTLSRWALPPLVALVPLVVFALPTFGQRQDGAPAVTDPQERPGQPPKPEPRPSQPPKPEPSQAGGDFSRAHEIAQLIKQGQMNLRDATDLAEKHCKGTAIEGMCDIESGSAQPPRETPPGSASDDAQDKPGQPPKTEPPKPVQPKPGESDKTAKRLVYEICVVTDDKIQAVRIDGSTKKVIDMKERKSFGGRPMDAND